MGSVFDVAHESCLQDALCLPSCAIPNWIYKKEISPVGKSLAILDQIVSGTYVRFWEVFSSFLSN